MKRKKKGFILYDDMYGPIRNLTLEEKGLLLSSIFEYQLGEGKRELPVGVDMAYNFIIQQLERDNERYEDVCKARSESGKLGGRPQKAKEPIGLLVKQKNQIKAKKADKEKDTDIDTEKDKKIVIEEKDTHSGGKKIENEIINNIVEYLNEVSGRCYKKGIATTEKCIKSRIVEGFTKDDFERVIDFKVGEWKDDPEFSKFIRPQTLFGTKMEGYLQSAKVKPKGSDKVDIDKLLTEMEEENEKRRCN